QYQIETRGDYSVQIRDYVDLGITQSVNTPDGEDIITMIDPYSYRKDLTMPKMIFMGANDPYWVVDNVKNYLSDIPGNNMLHYVANAGHDLGDGKQAMNALNAFFANTMNGGNYPEDSFMIKAKKSRLEVTMYVSPDILEDIVVWTA